MITDLSGKIAVVTGGGTGMGRESCDSLQPAAAMSPSATSRPTRWPRRQAMVAEESPGVRVLTHMADVSKEADLEAFRDAIVEGFDTDSHPPAVQQRRHRRRWLHVRDRAACVGTDLRCRLGRRLPRLPRLPATRRRRIRGCGDQHVGVNGFYASVGPDRPHTAYSASKFAVKGFTEALITDLQVHAPHVSAHVVMPGHIGTKIVANSLRHAAVEPTAEVAEFMIAVDQMFEEQLR